MGIAERMGVYHQDFGVAGSSSSKRFSPKRQVTGDSTITSGSIASTSSASTQTSLRDSGSDNEGRDGKKHGRHGSRFTKFWLELMGWSDRDDEFSLDDEDSSKITSENSESVRSVGEDDDEEEALPVHPKCFVDPSKPAE